MVETETKIQRYDSYKDSGVEWLGEIPEHWEVLSLKRLLSNNDGGIWNEKFSEKGIPVYRSTEINIDGSWGQSEPIKLILSEKELEKVILKYGDLIVTKSSGSPEHIGKTAIYKKNEIAAYSNFTQRIRFTEINDPDYYFYVLNSDISKFQYKVLTKSTSGLGNLNAEILGNLHTINPPLPEQTAIAQFLDDKTTKIDQAIAIKQQQIALLKERKQILIHKAVTRGLNDKVALKDSGVEWIEEIPEHWEVKQFRYMFNLGKGLTITKENLQEEGVYCINYGEIHSKYGFEIDTEIHPLKCVDKEYLETNSNALIKYGDFVFADTSEDVEGSGNFTYLKSDNDIFAGYHTVIVRPKEKINSRFFAYIFESESFRNQVRTEVKGVKVYSITQSILKRPFVWFPSIEEQNEIVEFLDIETAKIETAINLKEQEIEKLQEYKSSLINSVVTGKVRVF